MELEENGRLPFLGMDIIRNGCRLDTKVYRKPTDTGLLSGPAQQDFEWGGSSVSQIFFFFFFGGGGGRGAEACYPGKIRVLVILRYRKVDLK